MARRPAMTAPAPVATLPRRLPAAAEGARPVARQGKKAFACWIEPVLAKRFRRVMVDLELTVQQGLTDAITDFVARHEAK